MTSFSLLLTAAKMQFVQKLIGGNWVSWKPRSMCRCRFGRLDMCVHDLGCEISQYLAFLISAQEGLAGKLTDRIRV